MKIVQSMFKGDLREASASIFPVLTRVVPRDVGKTDEDFDLDIVKGQLMEIFKNDIRNKEMQSNTY